MQKATSQPVFPPPVMKVEPLKGSLEELLQTFENAPEISTKQRALLGIVMHYPQSREARNLFSRYLDDPQWGIVVMGIIGCLQLREYLPQVRAVLQRSHHPYLIAGALTALTDFDEVETHLDEFLAKLRHPHSRVRYAAARGLAKLQRLEALAVLKHGLSSPFVEERFLALSASDTAQSAVRIPLLIKSLSDDPEISDEQGRWSFRWAVLLQLASARLRSNHLRRLERIFRCWCAETPEIGKQMKIYFQLLTDNLSRVQQSDEAIQRIYSNISRWLRWIEALG